jgi:hypothetical protein
MGIPGSVAEPFTIRYEDLELKIMLVELSEVKIHEEIVPKIKDDLIRSLGTLKVIKDPIIVDEDSLTVLDGMHRVASLKELNARLVPVCTVDYKNPSIKVYRWYRSIKFPGKVGRREASKLGLAEASPSEADSLLDKKMVGAALIGRGEALVSTENVGDQMESSWVVKAIESGMRDMGAEVGYDDRIDAFEKLEVGSVDYILMHQPVSVECIVRSASTGKLFAHKSTRHIIPGRPLGVNVPLGMLTGDLDLGEANRELMVFLSSKRFENRSRGMVIGGRRYEEPLTIFLGESR